MQLKVTGPHSGLGQKTPARKSEHEVWPSHNYLSAQPVQSWISSVSAVRLWQRMVTEVATATKTLRPL